MRTRVVVLVAAVTAAANNLGAQRAPATADETARAFVTAFASERWLDAARLLDLSVLEKSREATLKYARAPRVVHQWTVEELMKVDPEMPRAVAEYQIKRMGQTESDQDREMFSMTYANILDTTALKAATPLELGARWMEARGIRYHMQRAQARAPECPIPPGTDTTLNMPGQLRAYIGTIVQGDTAFAVVRNRMFENDPEAELPSRFKVDLLVLLRRQATWKVIPDEMFGGMGSTFITCGSGGPPPA